MSEWVVAASKPVIISIAASPLSLDREMTLEEHKKHTPHGRTPGAYILYVFCLSMWCTWMDARVYYVYINLWVRWKIFRSESHTHMWTQAVHSTRSLICVIHTKKLTAAFCNQFGAASKSPLFYCSSIMQHIRFDQKMWNQKAIFLDGWTRQRLCEVIMWTQMKYYR